MTQRLPLQGDTHWLSHGLEENAGVSQDVTPKGLAVAREGYSVKKYKRLLKVCSSHVKQISSLREHLTAEQFSQHQKKPSRGSCGEPSSQNV